jgi:hypothetical protein
MRIASIVASEPELTYRQRGRPKRRTSSSPTTMASSVGAAKWLPSGSRSVTARVTAGCACPWTIDPKPLWKSIRTCPSTSETRDP